MLVQWVAAHTSSRRCAQQVIPTLSSRTLSVISTGSAGNVEGLLLNCVTPPPPRVDQEQTHNSAFYQPIISSVMSINSVTCNRK